MYAGIFGFSKRPFSAAPLADDYFPAAAIENARETLARCIERAEGAAMVVGPPGTGKSLLCRVLAETFRGSLNVVLLSSSGLTTRRNLLQAVLHALGQVYRGMDDGELRLALVDYLTTSDRCSSGMLLLVDEAHSLPMRLLEEIRTLTDLARDGRPAVRLVLVGGCSFEERLAHPRLSALSQRVVARCYLETLNRSETRDYVRAQVTRAGAAKAEAMFSLEACQNVFQATGGVPRLINQVCDHTLLLAAAAGEQVIRPGRVEEAWADLQQLPMPTTQPTCESGGGGTVEFGCLDDSADDDVPVDDTPVDGAAAPPLRISPVTEASDGDAGLDDDPVRKLEQIEQLVGEASEDFEPAGAIGPELELVFDNPFGEEFERVEPVAERGGPTDEGTEPAADAAQTADDWSDDAEFSCGCDAVCETLPLHGDAAEGGHGRGNDDIVIVEEDYDDTADDAPPIVAVRRHDYGRLFTRLRHG